MQQDVRSVSNSAGQQETSKEPSSTGGKLVDPIQV